VIIPDPRRSDDRVPGSDESTAEHSLVSLDDGSAEMTAEQAPLDLSDFEDLDFNMPAETDMDDDEFGGLLVGPPGTKRHQNED